MIAVPKRISGRKLLRRSRMVITAIDRAATVRATAKKRDEASATITPAHKGAYSLRKGISLNCTGHSLRPIKVMSITERKQG